MNDLNNLKKEHDEEDLNQRFKTACVDHAMKNEHLFNYGQTEILHKENHLRKRLALESMYIYNERGHACNYRIDTENLNTHTRQIINAYTFLSNK